MLLISRTSPRRSRSRGCLRDPNAAASAQRRGCAQIGPGAAPRYGAGRAVKSTEGGDHDQELAQSTSPPGAPGPARTERLERAHLLGGAARKAAWASGTRPGHLRSRGARRQRTLRGSPGGRGAAGWAHAGETRRFSGARRLIESNMDARVWIVRETGHPPRPMSGWLRRQGVQRGGRAGHAAGRAGAAGSATAELRARAAASSASSPVNCCPVDWRSRNGRVGLSTRRVRLHHRLPPSAAPACGVSGD